MGCCPDGGASVERLRRHKQKMLTPVACREFGTVNEAANKYGKIRACWYREDRLFLVMMSIWALAILAFILQRFTHTVL